MRDAAYAKLAKLRGHAASQARTACSLLANLDFDVGKEMEGRILSRDKNFLQAPSHTTPHAHSEL